MLDNGRQLRTLDDARAVIIEVYGSVNVRFGILNDVISLLLTAAEKGKRDDIAAVTDAIERVTWREIPQDVPQAALLPDAREQKSGPQLIMDHSRNSTKPIGTITPKTVPAMRRIRSATVSPTSRR